MPAKPPMCKMHCEVRTGKTAVARIRCVPTVATLGPPITDKRCHQPARVLDGTDRVRPHCTDCTALGLHAWIAPHRIARHRMHRTRCTASDCTAPAIRCARPPRGRLRFGNQPEPNSPAAPARARTQAAARGSAVNLRGGRRAARVLGLEDQPGGDRPGIGVPQGRARHARDLWRCREEQRESLVQLARESRQKGWWHAYGDSVQPHFATYLGLESAASEIRIYEVNMIPGLLQTEEYARTVISAGMVNSPRAEIERRVALGNGAAAADQEQPAEGMDGAGRGSVAPPGRRTRGHARAAGVPARTSGPA